MLLLADLDISGLSSNSYFVGVDRDTKNNSKPYIDNT